MSQYLVLYLSGYRVYQELGATNQLTDHEGVHFANKTGCIFQFLSLDAASRGIESMPFPQGSSQRPAGEEHGEE
jgi:hypothetical protein